MPESVSQLTNSPAQEEAIHHDLGPCEVLAGPGSGKTCVLVQRILYLIRERGVTPSGILVMTFSRGAALEMRRRFLEQYYMPRGSAAPSPFTALPEGEEGAGVTFGTFHSVFYHIYRISSGSNPSIISGRQSGELLNNLILRHLGRPARTGEVHDAAAMISRIKSTGRFPPTGDPKALSHLRGIYEDYNAYLEENALIDFEDMISSCDALLRSRPEELRRWQDQYQYIMVDEYQDTNAGQADLLRMLAGERRNLYVVGDDDQSIYGFRGSDPSFMRDFTTAYPDARRIVLDINYRCAPEIVRASHQVIRVNQNRLEKPVRPAGNAGTIRSRGTTDRTDGVLLREYTSTQDQYQGLEEILSAMTGKEQSASAIILRTHAQMTPLMRYLGAKGIDYQEAGRNASRSRVNPVCEENLRTIIGYYRLAEELANGKASRSNLFMVMNRPERYLLRKDFRRSFYTEEELQRLYPAGSNEAAALRTLCRDAAMLRRLTPPLSLRYLTRVIGFQSDFARLNEVLASLAADCGDSAQFLRLLEQIDLSDLPEDIGSADPSGVHIMTMHAAKGLEFDTVFLPDLNEGLLPSRRSRSPEAIEEERRLFYVAMTRARHTLYLMYLRGTKLNPRLPTRFLHPLGVKDWE